jgi:hypothetical protein
MSDISAENVTTVTNAELAEGERLFELLEAQPAQITPGSTDKIDANFVDISLRRTRRGALWTLEKSGQELIDAATGERESAVAMACVSVAAEDYSKRLREFADMMESASIRIRVALCSRPDMESVLKEAERDLDSDEAPNGVEAAKG